MSRRAVSGVLGLLVIVVGALFITTEYRNKMIRLTLAASPRRSRVLAAKAIVLWVATFVTGLLGTVVAAPLGERLARHNGVYIFPVPLSMELRVAFGTAAAGHAFAQTAPAVNAGAAAPVSSAQNGTAASAAAGASSGAATGTLPAINVNAGSEGDGTVGLVAKRSRSGTKTDTPITEIPQTINVVTAQQIEMTGATDVNAALDNLEARLRAAGLADER